MGITALYESGERSQDKGHFRNVVMIARADGVLTSEERALLEKIGSGIGLTDEQMADIIRNPQNYSFTPPIDRAERFEQVVNLVQMAQVDGSVDPAEMDVLERIVLELGYKSLDDVDVESILALVVRGEDTDVIVDDLL